MRVEIYPKIVMILETTRSEEQIRRAMDAFYEDAKRYLRNRIAADPQTRIVSWHYHLSTGAVDEDE